VTTGKRRIKEADKHASKWTSKWEVKHKLENSAKGRLCISQHLNVFVTAYDDAAERKRTPLKRVMMVGNNSCNVMFTSLTN